MLLMVRGTGDQRPHQPGQDINTTPLPASQPARQLTAQPPGQPGPELELLPFPAHLLRSTGG